MEFNRPNPSLSGNNEELFHVPNVLYENRYCNQDDFSILICGGKTTNTGDGIVLNDVYELKLPYFNCSKFLSMLKGRCYCKTAVFNSDILVVSCYKSSYYVEVFKNNRKCWCYKTVLFDKRDYSCICTFKQN